MIGLLLWMMMHQQTPTLRDWSGTTPEVPLTITFCMDSNGSIPCPEPVDVPAIQGERVNHNCRTGNGDLLLNCTGIAAIQKVDTCADKSRVLLTSEDGHKHCIKF